jgi:aldose 1-epimerase
MVSAMVGASGDQHVVEAAGYRAVVTECGAGLRTLEYAGRPLVQGYPENRHASAGRGQLLVPWPNRIADGHYRFEGQNLQLPLTEVARGHASHGLVRWVAWSLLSGTDDSVRLGYRLMAQPGYPWTLDLTARYAVSPDGLEVTVTAENLSSTAAPFAAGAHPYLSVGPGPVDSWELTLPGATALEVDDRKIPTGRRQVTETDLDFRSPRPIGATVLDTAYTDLDRDPTGRATVTLRGPDGGVALWLDAAHRWVQVYTADELPEPRASLAVEPMTAPPDAFNSGDDVLVLEPGGSLELTWGLHALD